MNQVIDIFEDILACNFIELCCKNSHLRIVFGVLSLVFLLCEDSFEIVILLFEILQTFLNGSYLLDGSLIEFVFEDRFQGDQSPPVVLELEPPPIDRLLSIDNLVPQLLRPFGQQPQDRTIMNLELRGFDVFIAELRNTNGYFLPYQNLFLVLFPNADLFTAGRFCLEIWIHRVLHHALLVVADVFVYLVLLIAKQLHHFTSHAVGCLIAGSIKDKVHYL